MIYSGVLCYRPLHRSRALTWPAASSRMPATVQASSRLVSGWVWWPVFSWFSCSPTVCIWSCSCAQWIALMTPRARLSPCPKRSNCWLYFPPFILFCPSLTAMLPLPRFTFHPLFICSWALNRIISSVIITSHHCSDHYIWILRLKNLVFFGLAFQLSHTYQHPLHTRCFNDTWSCSRISRILRWLESNKVKC